MSVVIIPARYSSTRFHGKVLVDIDGDAMIIRVAKQALKSKADEVIVVTDNEKVFNTCKYIDGIKVLMSPPELATGTDRVAFVAKELKDEIIINLQGDEPFVPPELIDSLIDGLEADKDINLITACTKFKNKVDELNPSNVKVVFNRNNYALYFSRYPIPYNRDNIDDIIRYRHIGIYGFRREYLLKFAAMEKSNLEAIESLEQLRALESGVMIKVVETDYNPISIDTEEDLQKALRFIKERSN